MRHPSAVFAVVAAVALAAVLGAAEWFADDIADNRAAYRRQLTESLLAGAAYDEVRAEAAAAALPSARVRGLLVVRRDGVVVAALAEVVALRGYGGAIEFLLALRRGGAALAEATALPLLRVVRHRETPGIADFLTTERVSEVFDGVAGATISSAALATAAKEVGDWADNCFDWTAGAAVC